MTMTNSYGFKPIALRLDAHFYHFRFVSLILTVMDPLWIVTETADHWLIYNQEHKDYDFNWFILD